MNSTEHLDAIIEELEYSDGIATKSESTKPKTSVKNKRTPLKLNLIKQTFDSIEELDAIYFSGEHPIIYFKKINDINPTEIKSLHKKVWNQGRVPLMFIVTGNEIRIYNCYKEPLKENDNNTDQLLVDRFELALDSYEKLRDIYHVSKIDSGEFWQTSSGKKINTTQKVDKLLVQSLQHARSTLLKLLKVKREDAFSIIHNLLCRSLFILYLEDRKVIDKSYYSKFVKNGSTYFDVLQHKIACYNIFRKLNKKFNGNLFITSKKEVESVKTEHLEIIRQCFYGGYLATGQLTLWRMFDFSYIPIELISSIYEEFLHTEETEDNIKNQGAYYTPLALVEFMLNEVLPFPDEKHKNYALKILDPACGSGIFLVEAYRRLVERWRYVNNYQPISTEDLKFILNNSIYGVEKNKEAIKVAAFSLYLTMLNYLEPKYIWQKVKFPKLINSKQNNEGHLYNDDTFVNKHYLNFKYDLVVGNPPWKRGGLDEPLKEYNRNHGFAQEAVLPFLHKMPQIAPNAQLALVSTAKILFNSSSGYEKFREVLFNETSVSSIINFSALRKSKGEIGRKLFSSASGPTIVIFYRNKNSLVKYFSNEEDTIIYCSPKPQVRDSALAELIIDPVDIKFIPKSEAQCKKSNIWKIAMWGTFRDKQFIDKFSDVDSLLYFMDCNKPNWHHGGGFRTTVPQKFTNQNLKSLPYIIPAKIERYYTPKSNTEVINDTKFERLGEIESYKSPHILIKEGQSRKRFCASYVDYDCTFRSNTYGIHFKGKDSVLKTITAYLNSKFSSYYLFLSGASWGVERERVEFINMLSLPAFNFLFEEKFNRQIDEIIDKIIELKTKFELGAEARLLELENNLDEIFYKKLNLNKDEISLIENVVDYSLDFFQEGEKSIAIMPTVADELLSYCNVFCRNLRNLLVDETQNIWSKVYQVNPHSELTLISIHFNGMYENGKIIYDDKTNVQTLLKKLNRNVYLEYTESIYFRKFVKFYDKDLNAFFIVKLNEKRFWTNSLALEDSDAAFIEWFN